MKATISLLLQVPEQIRSDFGFPFSVLRSEATQRIADPHRWIVAAIVDVFA